jgi:YVTN family beta-propeller protein
MKFNKIAKALPWLLLAYGLPVAAQQYAFVPNVNASTVTVVDTADNSVVTTLGVGTLPGGVAVSPDGSRAYVANRGSNTLSIIDVDTLSVVDTIATGTLPSGVAVSADGSRVYVTNYSANTVTVLDATTDTVVATIPVGSRPQGVAVDPRGEFVVVAHFLGDSIGVIDAQNNLFVGSMGVGDGPIGVTLDSNGSRLYVANSLDGTVSALNIPDGMAFQTIATGGSPQSVTVDSEAGLLYVGNFSPSGVQVVSLASNTIVDTIPLVGGVRNIAVAPNSSRLFAATQSPSRVAVIDTATRALTTSIALGLPRPIGNMSALTGYGQGGLGAGHYHQCRIQTTGNAACWGRDDFGQAQPVAGQFTSIGGGSAHTCALSADGNAVCWGNNDFGQATAPAGVFTQIASGFRHACGLREDRSITCWGDDSQGQATPPVGAFAQVSAGSSHSCAISAVDSSVICWGRAAEGQLAAPGGAFQSLALGASFSCGIQANSELACWGRDDDGQSSPPAGTFTHIAAEAFYACGIQTDGEAACWGSNAQGQQGVPSGRFIALSTGRTSACGLRVDGLVDCWGSNAYSEAPQFELQPGSLPNGNLAEAYSQAVTFTNSNPNDVRPPYALQSPVLALVGDLPPGLSMDASGLISGTPTQAGSYDFTVLAEDANGFHAEADYTIVINLSAPIITPQITGTMGSNGWYVGNVSLSWSVVDPETPVTSTTGCGNVVRTVNTTGTSYTCEATSDGGTNSVTVTIKLDKNKPILAPTVNDARPLLNNPNVVASANATDAVSGIASASCGVADTSTIGLKTITCTATDAAGNVGTNTTAFRVVYGFVGFTGVTASWNSAVLDQPIEVQYQLVDFFGAGVAGVAAPSRTPVVVACPAGPGAATVPSGNPVGFADLGGGNYRIVWQGDAAPGCFRNDFLFDDTNVRRVFMRYN